MSIHTVTNNQMSEIVEFHCIDCTKVVKCVKESSCHVMHRCTTCCYRFEKMIERSKL